MKSSHDGHRARMRERLARSGLDAFQPHEVIELLLGYALPLRDVNDLAHMLIERFGTVAGVLRAPEEELTQVPGVGEYVARFLVEAGKSLGLYECRRLCDRVKLVRLRPVVRSMSEKLVSCPANSLGVLLEDRAGYLLAQEVFSWHGPLEERLRDIVHFALRHRAHNAVIMHYLGEREAAYTHLEVEEANGAVHTLAGIDVYAADFLVMQQDRIISLRGENLIREMPMALREEAVLYENWFNDI